LALWILLFATHRYRQSAYRTSRSK
jgi:hypothetical protein